MAKKCFLFLWLILFSFYGADVGKAQRDASQLHVDVVLVQLNVAVTDSKGNYISGLRPEDFIISEDNIPQKTATFEEGNEAPRRLLNVGSGAAPAASTATMVAAEPPSTACFLGGESSGGSEPARLNRSEPGREAIGLCGATELPAVPAVDRNQTKAV